MGVFASREMMATSRPIASCEEATSCIVIGVVVMGVWIGLERMHGWPRSPSTDHIPVVMVYALEF